jgi:hypothetical protein
MVSKLDFETRFRLKATSGEALQDSNEEKDEFLKISSEKYLVNRLCERMMNGLDVTAEDDT